MSYFFQATSKVQKDRHVMRETDMRMAKYSRRGLIFNFIAFLICLIGGRFIDENRELTIILTSGLLLITLLRGIYLFRFDQLYPRGPARWRNTYFLLTLIGACWWGVILMSITLVLGLKDETPLFWLYTVVFFSTTAHAFAPYHRFLSYYQFLGLVPAAVAAAILGGGTAYVYSALMLTFYLILSHQCRLISDTYWEKLEAGYALGRRIINEEKERISSRASLHLSKEFMINLVRELTSCLSSIESDAEQNVGRKEWANLKSLEDNAQTFKGVVTRELGIENRVFNIRHELQYLVSEFIGHAEKRDMQLETALSTNLPMRLRGDPVRFAQIVRTLLSQVVLTSRSSAVILEVQFLREYESAGELYLTVRRIHNKSAMHFFSDTRGKSELPDTLALTAAKGLAELMDGEIEVMLGTDDDYQILFNARLEIADHSGQLDFHKDRFTGNKILLVNSNPAILDLKRVELDALGFTIGTETHFKRAIPLLLNQVKAGTAVENVLVYHEPNNEESNNFIELLRDKDELKGINKIIVSSPEGQKQLEAHSINSKHGFYFVAKPLGLFELESTFDYIYSNKGDEQALSRCRKGTIILVVEEGDGASLELPNACAGLPDQTVVTTPRSGLEVALVKSLNAIVVVPCSIGADVGKILNIIRSYEAKLATQERFIPIIGVGKDCSESEIAAFETGFDDYLNQSSDSSKNLRSILRYWRSLDL